MIRYIEVKVTPTVWARQGNTDLHMVEIEIRTDTDRVDLKEVIPDSEFVPRFEWMMKRITREVIDRAEAP